MKKEKERKMKDFVLMSKMKVCCINHKYRKKTYKYGFVKFRSKKLLPFVGKTVILIVAGVKK